MQIVVVPRSDAFDDAMGKKAKYFTRNSANENAAWMDGFESTVNSNSKMNWRTLNIDWGKYTFCKHSVYYPHRCGLDICMLCGYIRRLYRWEPMNICKSIQP